MTLEDLLRMEVDFEKTDGAVVKISPEFRVSVQHKAEDGVRIIIHAQDYDSDTLDFVVNGNFLEEF